MKQKLFLLIVGCISALYAIHADTGNFDLKIESSVQVSFQTTTAKAYQIESSFDVNPPVWRSEGRTIEGTGQRQTGTFLTGQNGKRIFRVVEISLTQGLVSYYPFNGNANDAVGSNHGVVTGAILAPDMHGNADRSYSFKGTNSWILAPDTGFPAGNNPRTVSLWINFRTFGVFEPSPVPFITYGNGQANDTYYAILFGLHLPDNPIAVGQSGTTHLSNLPRAEGTQLNRWYHVAFSHDGMNTKLYIDGALRGTYARTYATILNGEFWIGSYTHKFGWNDTSATHDGYIDNVRVYNRPLSENEVRALADLGQ